MSQASHLAHLISYGLSLVFRRNSGFISFDVEEDELKVCPVALAGLHTAKHQFYPPLEGRTVRMGSPLDERNERRRRRREIDPSASDSEDEDEVREREKAERDELRRAEEEAMRRPARPFPLILEIDGQPVLRHRGMPPPKPKKPPWGVLQQQASPPPPLPPPPQPRPPRPPLPSLGPWPKRLPGKQLEYPIDMSFWGLLNRKPGGDDGVFLFGPQEEAKERARKKEDRVKSELELWVETVGIARGKGRRAVAM